MISRLSGIDRRLARLSLVSWLVLGCSSGLIGSSGSSANEVETLKRRIVELQRRATVGEVEVARLEREVARLEAELARARSEAAAPPSPPPPIDPVGPGLIQPDIEESDLEEPPMAAEPPGSAVAPPPPASPTRPAEAQALYDEGYTLFHQQSYSDAEARFQRYIDLYPQTDLADNAQFWIGESRYARRDYRSALEAFSATVERFPHGNKVADALFKAGRCLETLGEIDRARSTYQEVARRYPGSAASAQARERLASLR